jgi:hypothetical protein
MRNPIGSLGHAVVEPQKDADRHRKNSSAPDFPVVPKNPGGRPPIPYDPALADEICDRIARGEVAEEILRDQGMPSRTTMVHWLDRQPEFATAYARARGRQAEAIAERGFAEAWADLEPQQVNRARLRWDASKWMAGKIDPARWSDKAEMNVTVTDNAASERRAELVAALQRLAIAAPLVEGEIAADGGEDVGQEQS